MDDLKSAISALSRSNAEYQDFLGQQKRAENREKLKPVYDMLPKVHEIRENTMQTAENTADISLKLDELRNRIDEIDAKTNAERIKAEKSEKWNFAINIATLVMAAFSAVVSFIALFKH